MTNESTAVAERGREKLKQVFWEIGVAETSRILGVHYATLLAYAAHAPMRSTAVAQVERALESFDAKRAAVLEVQAEQRATIKAELDRATAIAKQELIAGGSR